MLSTQNHAVSLTKTRLLSYEVYEVCTYQDQFIRMYMYMIRKFVACESLYRFGFIEHFQTLYGGIASNICADWMCLHRFARHCGVCTVNTVSHTIRHHTSEESRARTEKRRVISCDIPGMQYCTSFTCSLPCFRFKALRQTPLCECARRVCFNWRS